MAARSVIRLAGLISEIARVWPISKIPARPGTVEERAVDWLVAPVP